jgi:hypothetical protein
MIGAISSNPIGAVSGKPTSRPPSLDAQLQSARNQLEDWVTCSSAKTPAGKVKIKQVSEKVENIKQQIKQADAAVQQRRTTDGTAAIGAGSSGASASGPVSRQQSLVDTYA